MAEELKVNTFEEIAEVLSHLATNYSNIAGLFYAIFYDKNPKEVTLQMYDGTGVLRDYSVKNLALSNEYRVTGSNTPEGTVPAAKGTIYQDLVNGDVFVKKSNSTSNENWQQLVSKALLDGYIMQGVSDPNGALVEGEQAGVVDAEPGTLYIDTSTTTLYIRLRVPTGEEPFRTYWEIISASTENFANKNLSNLSNEGKDTIKSLATEETGTMVTTIDSSSTHSQYPSAKAVYSTVSALGTALNDLSISVGSLPSEITSIKTTVSSLQSAVELKQDVSDKETATLTNSTVKYPSSALVYSLLGDVETLINNL